MLGARGAAAIVLVMLSGCRHRRVPVAEVPPPPPTYARTSAGLGHRVVTVSYEPANASHRAMEAWLLRDRPLDAVAQMVSELINLRRPVSFTVQECADLAYWDPSAGTLVVCYRYLEFVSSQVGGSDLRAVLLFTLLHEVAHALISELGLPILGRDEEAADRFAATFLLSNPRGGEALLASAFFFRKLSTERSASLWDEHLTDGQRFYDLVCLAWGAGPEKAGSLGPQLPAERRERCEGEFLQARNGWDRLLTPYSRVRGGETFWAR